jgi:hypothetical protein
MKLDITSAKSISCVSKRIQIRINLQSPCPPFDFAQGPVHLICIIVPESPRLSPAKSKIN